MDHDTTHEDWPAASAARHGGGFVRFLQAKDWFRNIPVDDAEGTDGGRLVERARWPVLATAYWTAPPLASPAPVIRGARSVASLRQARLPLCFCYPKRGSCQTTNPRLHPEDVKPSTGVLNW